DEGLAAPWALVVEEDAVAGEEPIGLAVIDRDPIGVELGHRIGRARVERRGLALWYLLDEAVELRGRGLIIARLALEAEEADRLEQAQRAHGVDVGGVFGRFEAHRDMALRTEVVDLIGFDLTQDAGEVRTIGEIAVMELEVPVVGVR